jgi:hypothetical protein
VAVGVVEIGRRANPIETLTLASAGNMKFSYNNVAGAAIALNQANSDLITFTANGTATFSYNGVAASSALTYGSSTTAAQVLTNLKTIVALSGTGAITVTGAAGGPYSISFGSGLTGGNGASGLGAANGTGAVTVTQPGATTAAQIQANISAIAGLNAEITFPSSGNSVLSYNGVSSGSTVAPTISDVSTAAQVLAHLTAIPGLNTASYSLNYPGRFDLTYNGTTGTTANYQSTVTIAHTGTATVYFNGYNNGSYSFDNTTTAALFQAYLSGITGLTAQGAVTVTGNNGGPFTVAFSASATTGIFKVINGTATIVISNSTTASQILSNLQSIAALAGSNVSVTGNTITFNNGASASLLAISSPGSMSNFLVSGSGPIGGPFTISFASSVLGSRLAVASGSAIIPALVSVTGANGGPFSIAFGPGNDATKLTVANSPSGGTLIATLTVAASPYNSNANGNGLFTVASIIDAKHFTYNLPSAANAVSSAGGVAGAPALDLYKQTELLQLRDILINGATSATTGVVASNGIHVNTYLTDVNADKVVDGQDKIAANTVAVTTPPSGYTIGFSAFPQIDPVILAFIGDYSVDAGVVNTIDSFVAQLTVLLIPKPPTMLTSSYFNFLNKIFINLFTVDDPV